VALFAPKADPQFEWLFFAIPKIFTARLTIDLFPPLKFVVARLAINLSGFVRNSSIFRCRADNKFEWVCLQFPNFSLRADRRFECRYSQFRNFSLRNLSGFVRNSKKVPYATDRQFEWLCWQSRRRVADRLFE
jgi:hypothetical protein